MSCDFTYEEKIPANGQHEPGTLIEENRKEPS
jgi:hypothetical protein